MFCGTQRRFGQDIFLVMSSPGRASFLPRLLCFLSLLSVKQHFGKTSWACHFQNPIWADFPWNPSISVGGIPLFLQFFLFFALVWVVGPPLTSKMGF